MTEQGYIKIFRTFKNNIFYRNSEAVHLWLHLLFSASYEDNVFYYHNTKIKLKRGQLITGRKKLALETGISESKIFRLLKLYENEHQIEQQKTNKYSIITIISYDKYNNIEQQNEQQMNNKRTTNEQQMNTTKELKELKEIKIYNSTQENNQDEKLNEYFDTFYRNYPNKKAKQKAYTSFCAILKNKKATFEQLMQGLDKYIAHINQNKIEKSYIKHPSTWLNQGCWEDEYEEQSEEDKIRAKEIEYLKELDEKDKRERAKEIEEEKQKEAEFWRNLNE